jgi:hypothetical protein
MSEKRVKGYERLLAVLESAYAQASSGKGKERHASGEPFEDQRICAVNRSLGSIDGAVFQVEKKAHEAARFYRAGKYKEAVHDLLGAINYAAAAVILCEDGGGNPEVIIEYELPYYCVRQGCRWWIRGTDYCWKIHHRSEGCRYKPKKGEK